MGGKRTLKVRSVDDPQNLYDGLDSFAGPVFHSAEWDHTVDLAGKRVASIGAGASAVQYVPQVAKVAEKVSGVVIPSPVGVAME